MWKPSREDPVEPLAVELVRECEALLDGRYADHLGAQGRWAPAWAWVNVLAHSTGAELAAVAAGDASPRPGEPPGTKEWRDALAFLADDLLAYVGPSPGNLRDVQASALVPLELGLMRPADRPPLNPGQLAADVLAAVHQHPSRPRR